MNHIWFCEYCSPTGSHEVRKHFLTQKDFVNHIRAHHLVHIFKNDVETFICRYGPNSSCLLPKDSNTFESSLSSHGTVFTSQRDYEKHLVGFHLLKHPVYKNVDIKSSHPAHTVDAHCDEKPSRKWSVHQSIVNLPAVLNDPNYRETDIFAKLWGDKFENAEVLPSPHLPVITEKHFIEYLNKIGIRKSDTDSCRSSPKYQTNSLSNSFSDSSPSVKSSDKALNDGQSPSLDVSLNSIPALYFDQTFNLKDEKTFCQVIPLHLRRLCLQNSRNPFGETGSLSVIMDSVNISKTRQREAFRTQHDKLVNYLDIIELNIIEQVSRKSSTFFEAIQCHDVIRGDLSKAISQIKDVRHKLQQIDTFTVIDKMKLLRIVRRRENYRLVVDKLKLISSLQATQPTIQTLLRNNDFCAALDLVSTTKELLHSHLMGNSSSDLSSERMVSRAGDKNSTQDSVITSTLNNNSTTFLCLRDFNSQLNGISNFVHKMVESEFEISLCRYLDPPVEEYGSGFNEPDILSCFLGLIRINRLDFVSRFRAEMLKRVKDIVSQHISSITQSLKNDYITHSPTSRGPSAATLPISDQLRNIPYVDWMAFLVNLCNDLKYLLIRGQDVVEIFQNNLCSKHHNQQSTESVFISSTHHHQSLNTISLDKAKELAKYMRKTLWDTANVAQKRLSSLISVRFRLGFNQSIIEPNLAASMTTPALSSTADSSLNSPNSPQKRLSSITPIDIGFTTVHSEYAFDKVSWNDFRELVKVMNIFQVYVFRTWLKFFDIPIETIIHRQSDHSDNCAQLNSHSSNYKSESCAKQLVISFNHKDDMTPSTIVNHNLNDHYLSNNQYSTIPTIQSDLLLSNLVLSMTKLIIDRFHREKCDKLNMLLDQERWQAAVCPEQVQQMIDDIFTKVGQSKINSLQSSNEHSSFSPNHSIQSTNNVTRSPNNVFLNDEQYTVVGTVILFLPMINEYVKLDEKLPSQPLATEFILDRLANLLNHFNSRVCQLVLGAEACKTVDLQRISAKNLALTLRSLQLVVHFLPWIRYSLERISEAELNKISMNVDNLLIASFYRCNNQGINRSTLKLDLDHVEKLFNEHIESILQKLVELLSDPISQHFSTWYGRPPIPSKQMKELCRNLSKLIETTSHILPTKILTSILLRVHNELKVQLRHRISELGIIADGGPQQSLIDSDILYYIDHFQSLTPQLQKFIDDCSDIWPSL
ncbi:hypothetical protein MN116_004136 [Schistosoma mekongi]|uniref:Vacuolar protein sorting-associated protein 54 n=1 Tax=Schistosoma mekongi TaxID=38744 RepID=A0AAE2D6G0_SCHME|nr:hypothetical protein MN116_004136 [Schistosoma mekongi]